MDRRSWLWRRKSSEKSPGETESSGGSISSHSERFSDDQIYSNQSFQSPEVTSKAELQPEELEGSVKTLSQKLSEALVNISIKEDLVKQHSKVAEEAVEGWEKAETEVLSLRQQIEVLTLRNSTLEDRACHLDGALKECLRQLRQTREENEEKIEEIIQNKTSEFQKTKTALENQISDLHSQLEITKTGSSSASIDALKLELASMAEELELRFIERELSNQAAEQASKLHLESAKKAAKFEAECRRLNAALQKALANNNNQKSVVESDDLKETNEFESSQTGPKRGINLMDDFLEMERLVGRPDSGSKNSLQNRMAEIEDVLKRVELEKQKMETVLSERENELKTLRNELKVAKSKLVNANDARETAEKELESVKATVNVLRERVKRSDLEMAELKSQLDTKKMEIVLGERENELETSRNEVRVAKSKLVKLEALLVNANDAREITEKELESVKGTVNVLQERIKRSDLEVTELKSQLSQLNNKKTEAESRVTTLETEIGTERAKCRALETELESLIRKVDYLETETENERALSGKMSARCRELETELESLNMKVGSLETEVENERTLSNKLGVKARELEGEISRLQRENQPPKPAIRDSEFMIKQDNELALAGTKFADCQKTIASLNRQLKTLATLEDFLIDTNEFSRLI
ncbi:filament-like plant protein 3 [Bidens hawaiensis]|uniref:filament-like plant protein 3 n=1 Tax=Bidens hawaiensis TaxID=980011 RepID=UPI00404930B8